MPAGLKLSFLSNSKHRNLTDSSLKVQPHVKSMQPATILIGLFSTADSSCEFSTQKSTSGLTGVSHFPPRGYAALQMSATVNTPLQRHYKSTALPAVFRAI